MGKTPHWSTSSSDGHTAYVTNEGSNDVSVVDLARRTVTATIAVGNAPRKIAVQPASGATVTNPAPARAAAVPTPITLAGVTYADHGAKDVRNQAKLELEADDYYFSPTFLRGTPGQKLTPLVENEAHTLHNLSLPALGIDKDIPQGQGAGGRYRPGLGSADLLLQVPRAPRHEWAAAGWRSWTLTPPDVGRYLEFFVVVHRCCASRDILRTVPSRASDM